LRTPGGKFTAPVLKSVPQPATPTHGSANSRGRGGDQPSALEATQEAELVRVLLSDALDPALDLGRPARTFAEIRKYPQKSHRRVAVGWFLGSDQGSARQRKIEARSSSADDDCALHLVVPTVYGGHVAARSDPEPDIEIVIGHCRQHLLSIFRVARNPDLDELVNSRDVNLKPDASRFGRKIEVRGALPGHFDNSWWKYLCSVLHEGEAMLSRGGRSHRE
jgi:hypothetical protein